MNCRKYFLLRDMMDNQCANIFSTHATVYGSHSVKFAFIERENIFLYVYPQLNFFKIRLVCFSFPHLLIFLQNCFSQILFCFSYFYRGRSLFLILVIHRGSFLLFIGRVVSIFSYSLLRMFSVDLLIGLSLSIHDKKGEK